MNKKKLPSNRPYLIRGIYEWLIDTNSVPLLLVDQTVQDVQIPDGYGDDGQILLDIAPESCLNLQFGNEYTTLTVKFDQVDTHLSFPTAAILSIFGEESEEGLFFGEPDKDALAYLDESSKPESSKPKKGGHLKLIK